MSNSRELLRRCYHICVQFARLISSLKLLILASLPILYASVCLDNCVSSYVSLTEETMERGRIGKNIYKKYGGVCRRREGGIGKVEI